MVVGRGLKDGCSSLPPTGEQVNNWKGFCMFLSKSSWNWAPAPVAETSATHTWINELSFFLFHSACSSSLLIPGTMSPIKWLHQGLALAFALEGTQPRVKVISFLSFKFRFSHLLYSKLQHSIQKIPHLVQKKTLKKANV